jgi:hypothetical protein
VVIADDLLRERAACLIPVGPILWASSYSSYSSDGGGSHVHDALPVEAAARIIEQRAWHRTVTDLSPTAFVDAVEADDALVAAQGAGGDVAAVVASAADIAAELYLTPDELKPSRSDSLQRSGGFTEVTSRSP